ncbi:MAG: hypothetical protein M0Z49_07915 [Chloroflexi bacterium]|nr:hypothetical protein [Chloroflexota bacterium]MDA8236901.1 hypothetical protein [Chloroflexota bacterium]
MRRQLTLAASASVALLGLALVGAGPALAHGGAGGESLQVEPTTVDAGGTVVLAGSGLEPDNERVLVLAGQNLVVEFGTVTTDAEGMFSKELSIPGHLPAGTYELRAIGDETLTVPLDLTAGSAGAVPAAGGGTQETVTPRQRTPAELAIFAVLIAGLATAGGLLLVRGERLGLVAD